MMPERAPDHSALPGCLVLVVGSSGSGKDSLINAAQDALATDSRFHFPKRIITRAPDATENHEPVSREKFSAKLDSGAFLLHWHANGLSYAIPVEAAERLGQNRCVVVNVSRTIISDTYREFGHVRVVHVSADAEVLRNRLATRGRETASDRESRLERGARIELPPECQVDEVSNNGELSDASAQFIALLEGYAANSARE